MLEKKNCLRTVTESSDETTQDEVHAMNLELPEPDHLRDLVCLKNSFEIFAKKNHCDFLGSLKTP
jgi:hypothetical protein